MKIINRKFHRDYKEIEKYEAGIVLTGAEVKSIRAGGLRIDDAFVRIMDNGIFLINADIPAYQFASNDSYESKRSRKLLLHKKELLKLRVKMASGGLTLAPVSCYNKGPHIKLEIALVKGRKDIEKRKLEKRRDIKLEQEREAKEFIKL
jgi:SsrA-binding protein